jgi:hypothetical protein
VLRVDVYAPVSADVGGLKLVEAPQGVLLGCVNVEGDDGGDGRGENLDYSHQLLLCVCYDHVQHLFHLHLVDRDDCDDCDVAFAGSDDHVDS